MRLDGSSLVLSATDLSNFLGCRHRTALELDALAGTRTRPQFTNSLLELLWARGLEHERAYVEQLRREGRQILDLSDADSATAQVNATLQAMHDGADVIAQGAFRLGPWFGKPDLLLRVPTPSALGDWSYEIADTKLARETKAGTILQLGLYAKMLTSVQDLAPERFYVVTPLDTYSYRLSDFAAYVRLVEAQLASTVTLPASDIAGLYYPEPVDHCDICPWAPGCRQQRRDDDHLSLVAGLTRLQRRELANHHTTTLASLAQLPLPLPFRPVRGSIESYLRVREQARLQFEARTQPPPPPFQLRDDAELGEGLGRLPEPSPGDLYLDLEGNNLAIEGGREYLFGIVSRGSNGTLEYTAEWASNAEEERAGFERVIDRIATTIEQHPDMHVYHYAPYETTALKRLMTRYVTRITAVDSMLRAGRFVDLYAVVRQGLQAGVERYSIKNLEVLYGYTRAVPLADANKALQAFEYALATDQLAQLPQDARDVVAGYNRDDCLSTRELHCWLEQVRADAIQNGRDIPRPQPEGDEQKPEAKEREQRTEALRARLLAGIDGIPERGTPQHARWLLAYLLDFHRRDDKAVWWRYFELLGASDEDLLDASEAIAGLTFVERVETRVNKRTGIPTGKVVDRYAYPPQEMEIRRKARLKARDGDVGEVVAVDRVKRTVDIEKGKRAADVHPTSVFAFQYFNSAAMENALAAMGAAVADTADVHGANRVAQALLLATPPQLDAGVPFAQPTDVSASDFAQAVVHRLDHTVLAIQGPPGSGKTYTGARMIRALVKAGKRVGVAGPSHKAILRLLDEVAEQAARGGEELEIAHKNGEDELGEHTSIRMLDDNKDVDAEIAKGDLNVVGGTAWLWARDEMQGTVDVLFVDEAGQVSLANAVAMSRAAGSMVLLGDPQQLDQVQKGTHPDGVGASVLEHILGEHLTIPADRGIFLEETWRLAPPVCDFTSEVFYESRLKPHEGLGRQRLGGIAELEGSGLWLVDVDHDGCTSASDQEVDAVVDLVQRLTAPGATWTTKDGTRRPLGLDDVLVVSPFNAQVGRLQDALPQDARVGTVDKFQGQEAPVVIYSMATSRAEDAPRGMEFLYSLNRLNVATSRARCAVIVVANPRLYEPECRSPGQMRLANALCRYRELARQLPKPSVAKMDSFGRRPSLETDESILGATG